MKKMIVHMIGNAHIDPVWLWRWPEGTSEMLSTCYTMVKLLKESDDLVFTKGEAMMYEWIEETDPKLFEEIIKLVKSGKWNIVNGWWVQPDCNLPNGESFVRQSLYGKKFFIEKFGIDIKVGYNVDSFGHAGSLPQILKKSGFDHYVFMRPGPKEKILPSIFRWKSSDGSEITAFRLSRSYTIKRAKDLEKQIESSLSDVPTFLRSTMSFYGVGDHGGGPTMAQVKYIRKHKNFSNEVNLEFSSPERYFSEIENKINDLPVIEDELQYHSIGAYSVNSKIKILNRKSENSLLTAEKLATIVSAIEKMPYPYEKLENAWKSLLFNQFHDLLGGTAIKEAYEDAYNELGGVIHEADRIKQISLQTLVRTINTDGDGIPFIVFNPSTFAREEYVEFEPRLGQSWREKVLVDSDGEEIDYQKIFPSEIVKNTHRILFKAKVPPMGYRVYWLRNGRLRKNVKLHAEDNVIENDFYRLELTDDGCFKSFYDKKEGIERFSGPSNVLLVIDDKTDTWSHGVAEYPRKFEKMKNVRISLSEYGNLRATFRIEMKYKSSKIVEYVSAYAGDPVLRIHFVVNWREPYKLLKLGFSFGEIQKVFAEIPYGMIERPANGQEYPMQRAVFFENNGSGLMIANDGKYAYDAINGEGRITILRNPPYAWHMPYKKIRKNRPIYFTDEGIQEFDIWLLNYSKNQRSTGMKYAQALNSPLEVLSVPKHHGKLPSYNSFMGIDRDNVLLETLKMSESKDGSLIARVWETMGISNDFSVNLFGNSKTFGIKKHEIKTLKIDRNSFKEVNLLEK